jgi:hypothetical protein
VTGIASFILLADIGDQRLRTLHLYFEGGDQRVFRVNPRINVDKFGRDRVPLMSRFNQGASDLAAIEQSLRERDALVREQNKPAGDHPVRQD